MRICLVASELLGAHKNGGIGTATAHLAHLFAKIGHSVSVVYTGEGAIDFFHPWIRRLHKAGVTITHLNIHLSSVFPKYLREPTSIFDFLRSAMYDLIVFQDWRGGAFACVTAREAGLAFSKTRLAVIAHGPTEWLLEANRTVVRDLDTLAQLHMERTVYECADVVVSPSRYMADWVADHFELRARRSIPLYLWSDPDGDAKQLRDRPISQLNSIAFFGRLEERKGIALFVDALLDERLEFSNFKVLFLGKEATYTERQIRNIIGQRRPWLSARLKFETDLDTDQAQALLQSDDCLAIIPSLVDNAPCVISECLRRRIPFLSTNVGGIPEQIAPEDRDRTLFEPSARSLSERLSRILGSAFEPAAAVYAESDVAEQWRAWLNDESAALRASPVTRQSTRSGEAGPDAASRVDLTDASSEPDQISVIVTHYERPHLVNQTLESLAIQTVSGFEVILIDDGSTSRAAIDNLDSIERRDWPFPIRVIRKENQYLGAARNAGIGASSADFFIFMDDDNIAFPNFVETLKRAVETCDADIVTCQMAIFRDAVKDPDLELLRSGERWCFTGGPAELGLSTNCFGDATGIYRRRVFDDVGFFHERRGVGHEDWHLHARACLAGFKHLSLPTPLYWYRRTEGGMLHTTNQFENNRIIWEVYRAAIPDGLSRLVDLSLRSELFG